MSGRPRIEDIHEKTQPLGPLQDLGGAFAVAKVAAKATGNGF
jgi:hypothetical protein